ncbi:MAG: peptide chain release factor 2 [Thermodesulfobacterium geofontis]|uniref:Peptide chain release factor 2 n=2 Tax=Thermodesulfobacterium geofontis TaxID=1295609 RepID=A0A2N7PNS5_9BACT|nr:MAG: peptide chain release factor 2 [Thermodesulfobacterium geofontis]
MHKLTQTYRNVDLEKLIKSYKEKLHDLRGCLEPLKLKIKLAKIEEELQKKRDWDSEEVKDLLKERAQISEKLSILENLSKKFEEILDWYSLYKEDRNSETFNALLEEIYFFEKTFKIEETKLLLSGEYDQSSAILSIHAGTGGTDAQDWASILLRMYVKWAEKKGYKVKIVDVLPGEEAGIKNVVLLIEGKRAYGYLKGEKGVHRLIRISPFNANSKRHTSFASVTVIPEIEEDIEVEIKPEDLKIETMRASGHGGQHVNKTETAVRITHLPTGITVTCQNERSQYLNKMTALKILRSKLYQLEKQKLEQKKENLIGEKKEISWGNQIRTYTLHPYKVVKDHRTQYESYKVEEVLDGEIDEFIREYLLWESKQKFKTY